MTEFLTSIAARKRHVELHGKTLPDWGMVIRTQISVTGAVSQPAGRVHGHDLKTATRGMPVSTSDGWSGRIDSVVAGGDVVAIKTGRVPNDRFAGYRVFKAAEVKIIGGQVFVTAPKAIVGRKYTASARPRPPTEAVLEREWQHALD